MIVTDSIAQAITTDPIALHQRSKKVKFPLGTQDVNDIHTMLDVLEAQNHLAVAIAAPQIGIHKRIFVLRGSFKNGDRVIFNPIVLNASDGEYETETEGCLSLPHTNVRVSRPKRIWVKYQNAHGENVKAYLKGLEARIFLHELDHLNGVLIYDYTGPHRSLHQ